MEKYALDTTKVVKLSGMIVLDPKDYALIEAINSLTVAIRKIKK